MDDAGDEATPAPSTPGEPRRDDQPTADRPTAAPVAEPTAEPSSAPAAEPSSAPAAEPSAAPAAQPTADEEPDRKPTGGGGDAGEYAELFAIHNRKR